MLTSFHYFTLGHSYYYNGRFRFLPEAVPGLGDKSGTLVMDRYVDNCDGYEAAMGNCLVMLLTYSRSLVAEQYSNSYDRRKQCMHFEAVGMKEKACAVCFLNCLRLHGQEDDEGGQQVQTDAAAAAVACVRSSSSTRATEIINKEKNAASSSHSPSFLKKISKDDMNSTLQMPYSFVNNHFTRLGTTVILEGPSKQSWRVDVGGPFRQFSFRFGWKKFVKDHRLQIGDHLCFTLTADGHFQVEVYDEGGCQKASALDATNSPVEIKALNAKGPGTSSCRPLGSRKPMINDNMEDPEDAKTGAEKPGITVPVDQDLQILVNLESQGIEEGEVQLLPQHKLVGGHVVSQRRPVTDAEKLQTVKAAQALSLENPHTMMVMTRAYVYRGFWMAITKAFAKEWMPKETREVTLIDRAGNKWPTKWLYKDGGVTSGLSAGWRGFALDHRLEEGDVCVFELVDRENFGLLVHIFRVLGRPEEDLGVYRPTPHKSVKGGSDQQRRKRKTPDPFGIHQDPLGIQEPGNGLQDSSRKTPPPRTLDEDVGHGFTRGDFKVDGSLECHKVANLLPNFNLTPSPSCFNAVTNDTQPGSGIPLAVLHNPISEEIASPLTDFGSSPYRSKLLTKRKMEQDNRDSLIKMARELVIQNTSLSLKPATPPPAQAMGIKEFQQNDGPHFINLDLMSPQVCKVEPPSSSRLNFGETADSPEPNLVKGVMPTTPALLELNS